MDRKEEIIHEVNDIVWQIKSRNTLGLKLGSILELSHDPDGIPTEFEKKVLHDLIEELNELTGKEWCWDCESGCHEYIRHGGLR